MDTIYALASARGKAGVAVIRISGPESWVAARSLAGSLPDPRVAAYRKLRLDDELLDEALVVAFEPGRSFTGERSAELHVHGAAATVTAVLSALGSQPGLRMAEAGEFTRRALENGRLDLAQVEGLADLIEAETVAQRRQALRVLSGSIGVIAGEWRQKLVRAAALLEATIDFADEDVPENVVPEVVELLDEVLASLRREAAGARAAERVRLGYEVAIVGAPNTGKSTLLNALAGREAAITSSVAGTTRDVIEVRMDLGGLAVTLLDTAGLRDTSDEIEGIGVRRALDRAAAADLRLFLTGPAVDALPLAPGPDDILVQNKVDLDPELRADCIPVSALHGLGLDVLIERVVAVLADRAGVAGVVTRQRHEAAIRRAILALESARKEALLGADRAEIVAEDLRRGIRSLDSLLGRVDVEELLDDIFASFCIGK